MIIDKNLNFTTNSEYPDTDWTGEAKYVIPDDSELAQKIMCAPAFKLITNKNNELIDVEVIEPEITPEKRIEDYLHNLSVTERTLIEEFEKLLPKIAKKLDIPLSNQLTDILEERAEYRVALARETDILKGKTI